MDKPSPKMHILSSSRISEGWGYFSVCPWLNYRSPVYSVLIVSPPIIEIFDINRVCTPYVYGVRGTQYGVGHWSTCMGDAQTCFIGEWFF